MQTPLNGYLPPLRNRNHSTGHWRCEAVASALTSLWLRIAACTQDCEKRDARLPSRVPLPGFMFITGLRLLWARKNLARSVRLNLDDLETRDGRVLLVEVGSAAANIEGADLIDGAADRFAVAAITLGDRVL